MASPNSKRGILCAREAQVLIWLQQNLQGDFTLEWVLWKSSLSLTWKNWASNEVQVTARERQSYLKQRPK